MQKLEPHVEQKAQGPDASMSCSPAAWGTGTGAPSGGRAREGPLEAGPDLPSAKNQLCDLGRSSLDLFLLDSGGEGQLGGRLIRIPPLPPPP